MTEEIKHARKQAPRAIILSVYLGGITGFIFLIAACFCIGDIQSTAETSTLVPIIQIFHNSTRSVAGSTCLTVLLIVIGIGASNALTAEGGRAVYAFARDRGLPFSDIWSKVESKRYIPVYGLCLTVLVQIALNSIYFGTVTGFTTVVSIATEGFCELPETAQRNDDHADLCRRLICHAFASAPALTVDIIAQHKNRGHVQSRPV